MPDDSSLPPVIVHFIIPFDPTLFLYFVQLAGRFWSSKVPTLALIAAIMNVLLSPQPPLFPHHHPDASRLPPSASHSLISQTMSSRKRKADDDVDFGRPTGNDGGGGGFDDTMSVSPTASPAIATRALVRPSKRVRASEVFGRPLALPRLLETLDAQSLRNVLRSICDQHPEIGTEVVSSAPRPSVASALGVLAQYQEKLRDAFPFGGNVGSDYAYNRVRHALMDLIDALAEFTPHFLPPNETQVTTSLKFLDGATKVVHDLPNWESSSHKHHKDNAYDEISKAWALVISEASKKGGGFQLHNGEWDQKLNKHNEQSGGRMQVAVSALGSNLGWMGAGPSTDTKDPGSIRNQLFSGTYGSNFPVRVGPW